MSRPNFTPELFVSVGETGAMFTLRETYLHEHYIRGDGPTGGAVINGVYQGTVEYEERSRHLRNLGQDPDEAFEKALAEARTRGLMLATTRVELTDGLRSIHRRTQQEVLEEELRRRAHISHLRDCEVMNDLTVLPVRVLSFGKYKGRPVAEVGGFDRDYLNWLADQSPRKVERWELRRLYVETWLANHKAEVISNEHVGARGDRLEIDVLVMGVHEFEPKHDYPGSGVRLLVKMRDSAGRTFATWYGGYAWRPKEGERYAIRGTVKDHTEFRGRCETLLARVKAEEVEQDGR